MLGEVSTATFAAANALHKKAAAKSGRAYQLSKKRNELEAVKDLFSEENVRS